MSKLFGSLNTAEEIKPVKWYVDSGASAHMSGRSEWIENIREFPVSKVTVAKMQYFI